MQVIRGCATKAAAAGKREEPARAAQAADAGKQAVDAVFSYTAIFHIGIAVQVHSIFLVFRWYQVFAKDVQMEFVEVLSAAMCERVDVSEEEYVEESTAEEEIVEMPVGVYVEPEAVGMPGRRSGATLAAAAAKYEPAAGTRWMPARRSPQQAPRWMPARRVRGARGHAVAGPPVWHHAGRHSAQVHAHGARYAGMEFVAEETMGPTVGTTSVLAATRSR